MKYSSSSKVFSIMQHAEGHWVALRTLWADQRTPGAPSAREMSVEQIPGRFPTTQDAEAAVRALGFESKVRI